MDVRSETGWQAVYDDLDDAAEGVAVLVRLVDRGHHGCAGLRIKAADRILVEARHVVWLRNQTDGRIDPA